MAILAHSVLTDPLRNFRFLVEIAHQTPLGGYGPINANLGFMSVSGLAATTEPISYREGGDNTTTRKMPGQTDFPPVTLTRGLYPDQMLPWQWFREIFFVNYGGGTGPGGSVASPTTDFRTTVKIRVMEHPITNGTTVPPTPTKMGFILYNAWPASFALSDLDAGGNGVMVSSLTLHYEGFDIKSANGFGYLGVF